MKSYSFSCMSNMFIDIVTKITIVLILLIVSNKIYSQDITGKFYNYPTNKFDAWIVKITDDYIYINYDSISSGRYLYELKNDTLLLTVDTIYNKIERPLIYAIVNNKFIFIDFNYYLNKKYPILGRQESLFYKYWMVIRYRISAKKSITMMSGRKICRILTDKFNVACFHDIFL